MSINMKVEEIQKLEDGKHKGEIVKVEERTEPYHYIDIHISTPRKDGSDMIVKAGYPAKIFEDSKLGNLLKRFGHKLSVGENVNIDSLVGLDCEFITMTKGKYAEVIADSVTKFNKEESLVTDKPESS